MSDAPKTITHEEWMLEGTRLFGLDFDKWAFECPACHHVATVADFRKYKDEGARPESAATECIGRYSLDRTLPGAKYQRMIRKQMKNGGPCDWVAYGLFNICPVLVVFPGREKPVAAFAFAPAEGAAR